MGDKPSRLDIYRRPRPALAGGGHIGVKRGAMKRFLWTGAAIGVLVMTLPSISIAADAAHGKDLFKIQCGICHKAGDGDGEGVVGPSLKGLIGRKVGGDPAYSSYTPALTEDKAMWTEASLAVFLEDPQKAVPGTAMPIRVASPADRADLAAYLATVKAAP